jgi:hypothetical protein
MKRESTKIDSRRKKEKEEEEEKLCMYVLQSRRKNDVCMRQWERETKGRGKEKGKGDTGT